MNHGISAADGRGGRTASFEMGRPFVGSFGKIENVLVILFSFLLFRFAWKADKYEAMTVNFFGTTKWLLGQIEKGAENDDDRCGVGCRNTVER